MGTYDALVGRGIPSVLARRLVDDKHTLSSLVAGGEDSAIRIGLNARQFSVLADFGRVPVPAATVRALLFKSRSSCCRCRSKDSGVVIHHIVAYSAGGGNSEGNLIVLCPNCHSEVHTRRDLGRNISSDDLLAIKQKWEAQVQEWDAQIVMDACHRDGSNFLYFNHFRIFENAEGPTKSPYFREALRAGFFTDMGLPNFQSMVEENYAYDHGAGAVVAAYVRDVFKKKFGGSVLSISDILSSQFLGRVVRQGDVVAVQGKHYFKKISDRNRGKDQLVEGRRRIGDVRLSFVFDRWEATSCSAWATWLTGSPAVCSIGQVKDIERVDGNLAIKTTVLAIVQGVGPLRADRSGDYDAPHADFIFG